MKKITYLSMLRTVRVLRQCDPLLGMSIPTRTSNYQSARPGLGNLHVAPTRFLSQETTIQAELSNLASLKDTSVISEVNHENLLEDIGRDAGAAHNMNEGKTKDRSDISLAVENCSSPCEVLDIFSSNSYSESDLHAGIIKLWQLLSPHRQLKHSEEQLISEHPNLHNLCYGVMMGAPKMPTGYLVRSLYVFLNLKINQKSRVIQTLVVICQKRLSMFKEQHISLLGECLKLMESDRNVDILNSGFRLLIELKFKEIKTITSLLNLMKSMGRDAPSHLKLVFKGKAFQMIDNFTVSNCQNMFSVLADINLRAYDLLNACSVKLIDNIAELTYEDITTVLHCCIKLSYFNEKLLSAIGNNMMNTIDTWKVRQIAGILKLLSKLHFRHVPLLDYYAEDIMTRSDPLSVQTLSHTARIYSSLNHLPEGKGDKFLETLNKSLVLQCDVIQPSQLLGIVYSFCLLGSIPHSAIDLLLKDESLLRQENKTEVTMLKHIKLCMKLDQSKEFVSMHDLREAPVMCSAHIQKFHTYLQNYIGDSNLYKYSLQIPGSYYIDFLLAFDTEQNKLVPVDNIDATNSPHTIARIAVLCFSNSAFTLGTLHPNGNVAAKIRCVKSHGFDVVLVPVHRFLKLNEEEKMDFVRRHIFRESFDPQIELKSNQSEQILNGPH